MGCWKHCTSFYEAQVSFVRRVGNNRRSNAMFHSTLPFLAWTVCTLSKQKVNQNLWKLAMITWLTSEARLVRFFSFCKSSAARNSSMRLSETSDWLKTRTLSPISSHWRKMSIRRTSFPLCSILTMSSSETNCDHHEPVIGVVTPNSSSGGGWSPRPALVRVFHALVLPAPSSFSKQKFF